jgi:RimJ/RimL family protein N-acetyltransferase
MAGHLSAAMPPFAASVDARWREALPELRDEHVTLRELREGDAPSLATHLNSEGVNRHMAACPANTEAFVRFVEWTISQRRRGSLMCYGIVPAAQRSAVGLVQFWPIERNFFTAEWGFVIGESFWGTGLFQRAATLAIDSAFSDFGIHRLEARAVDTNRRGNRALEKLGAVREGVLRGGFLDHDVVRDHIMWSILAPEWQARRRGDAHGR